MREVLRAARYFVVAFFVAGIASALACSYVHEAFPRRERRWIGVSIWDEAFEDF